MIKPVHTGPLLKVQLISDGAIAGMGGVGWSVASFLEWNSSDPTGNTSCASETAVAKSDPIRHPSIIEWLREFADARCAVFIFGDLSALHAGLAVQTQPVGSATRASSRVRSVAVEGYAPCPVDIDGQRTSRFDAEI